MHRLTGCLFLFSAAAAAQFTSIEVRFRGVGCASCIESMPGRLQRLRGVEQVSVDATAGIVRIQLNEINRVRIEQVRDTLEQDGTKTLSASVRVSGMIRKEDTGWLIRPGGLPSSYRVDLDQAPEAAREAIQEGLFEIRGQIEPLRSSEGLLRIRATEIRPIARPGVGR